MSENWAQEQEKNYDEMYEKHYKEKEIEQLANRIFELSQSNEFDLTEHEKEVVDYFAECHYWPGSKRGKLLDEKKQLDKKSKRNEDENARLENIKVQLAEMKTNIDKKGETLKNNALIDNNSPESIVPNEKIKKKIDELKEVIQEFFSYGPGDKKIVFEQLNKKFSELKDDKFEQMKFTKMLDIACIEYPEIYFEFMKDSFNASSPLQQTKYYDINRKHQGGRYTYWQAFHEVIWRMDSFLNEGKVGFLDTAYDFKFNVKDVACVLQKMCVVQNKNIDEVFEQIQKTVNEDKNVNAYLKVFKYEFSKFTNKGIENQEKAKEIAKKIFDLIENKSFEENKINEDTKKKFETLLSQIDGIEEYFYEELSQLLNEGKTVNEISNLPEDDLKRIKGNNLRFGYLLGNYMTDGKFNDRLISAIFERESLNKLFYSMVRGSEWNNIVSGNEFNKTIFYNRIWQYKEFQEILNFDLKTLQNRELKKEYLESYIIEFYGRVAEFQNEKSEGILDLNYIYNIIKEKGYDVDEFIYRYDLANSFAKDMQFFAIDFFDDIAKPFKDLKSMYALASVYAAKGNVNADDLIKVISNVYAKLQSLNYESLREINLKVYINDEIASADYLNNENKDGIKGFFSSEIFGKQMSSIENINVNDLINYRYKLRNSNLPDEILSARNIDFDELLAESKAQGYDEGTIQNQNYIELKQLQNEIFNFIENDDNVQNTKNAKAKFLQVPLFNIRKINNYISLCNDFTDRFGDSGEVKRNCQIARSLMEWIVQNRTLNRSAENGINMIAQKQFLSDYEAKVPKKLRDSKEIVDKLAGFKLLVFKNCDKELYDKFEQITLKEPRDFFDENQFKIKSMFKLGQNIDGVLDYLTQNPQNTSALITCLINKPELFFYDNFTWNSKANIMLANMKNNIFDEYNRSSVVSFIHRNENLSSSEIAVAFNMSEKTFWWNRNKNLERLKKIVEGKSGLQIISETVSKLFPGQEDRFYDWLYKNRDELITENGVVKDLLERVQNNGFLTKEQEHLIKLVPEEKQDRFREYFKDKVFRDVVQTERAMKNMLIVDENFNATPVGYLENCIKTVELIEILKTAFEKFSREQINDCYKDTICANVSETERKAWEFMTLNDFIILARDIQSKAINDNTNQFLLDNCQIASNLLEDTYDVFYSVLKLDLSAMLPELFSKDFSDNVNARGGVFEFEDNEDFVRDYLSSKGFKVDKYVDIPLTIFCTLICQNNNPKLIKYDDYVCTFKPKIIANFIFENDYGTDRYNKILKVLNLPENKELKDEVEPIVIKLKNKKINDVFKDDKEKYNDFVKMIKNDEAHLIGKFISAETNLNLLYDVLKAGIDLNKIDATDLKAIGKTLEACENDEKKKDILMSFVRYANTHEKKDIDEMCSLVPIAQKIINNEDGIVYRKEEDWKKSIVDAIIFEVENSGDSLGKYIEIIDKKDLPPDVKQELENREEVKIDVAIDLIVSAINYEEYAIDNANLPDDINKEKLAQGIAQKLKSEAEKDAGDLAEIVNGLAATNGDLAYLIAGRLASIPEVARELSSEGKKTFKMVNNSAKKAKNEQEI